jgi:hypothetical protein
MKFRVKKYTQVFDKIDPGYSGLTKFESQVSTLVVLEKDMALDLLMFSFILLAMHQTYMELT